MGKALTSLALTRSGVVHTLYHPYNAQAIKTVQNLSVQKTQLTLNYGHELAGGECLCCHGSFGRLFRAKQPLANVTFCFNRTFVVWPCTVPYCGMGLNFLLAVLS